MESRKHPERFFRHMLSAPFIYAMSVPIVILDATMEVYHRVCFPMYGIPLVPRKQYIFISRQKMRFLNPVEKLHCAYCSYANGVMRYGAEIAGRTERYWCGIKERENPEFKEFAHRKNWPKWGDRKALEKEYPTPFVDTQKQKKRR